MNMKRRGEKPPKEKTDRGLPAAEEETAALNIQEEPSAQSIDEYQCCGSLEVDFPEVCALLGMNRIPMVTTQPKASSPTAESSPTEDSLAKVCDEATTQWSPEPRLQAELETEDPHSVRELRIFGWKADELTMQALSKILPSLGNLQRLQTVVLEGNPLPDQAFHILIAEDSPLTHLSLRNNCLGERGAHLIGAALSTARVANRSLQYLSLAFNSIGDVGAKHIAQGLRLNRTLLCLSLAYNCIGDAGAAYLAEVLGPFALTHEEIVERRRQMSKWNSLPSQIQIADSKNESWLSIGSSSSLELSMSSANRSSTKKKDMPKREEKQTGSEGNLTPGRKEETKLTGKGPDTKLAQGKGVKPAAKEKNLSVFKQEVADQGSRFTHTDKTAIPVAETSEPAIPVLEIEVQYREGKVIVLGNDVLTSLNLSGNRLTEQSLSSFLSSVSQQPAGGGLLRLSLSRNCFQEDCDTFLKLQELMTLRDPLSKTVPVDEEHEQAV
ncbi:leucine-rich repeat-containing protein 71-like isoform X2 [Brienomyrus brachyistius]|uniref:leucine-rich repeat-containing protein 71-like isoform X2 n=1 Tax=Brienomyrus brachyistius TaxID=42636 RepID=UPI0020B22027|nr:leucine-rich repeat-containing protein 71-like isoform X2 [Brienomyrus brachyistius]